VNTYIRLLALCLSVGSTVGLLGGCGKQDTQELIRSAQRYIQQNDTNAAIIQLKTALQQDPNSSSARLLLGQAMLDSGDPVSAEVELRKALALKEPEANVLPALARTMNVLGQSQKLIEQHGSVKLADPGAAADLSTSLAVAYGRVGKGKERDAALAAALAAVPDYGPAKRVQATLMMQDRNFEGALKTLDEVLTKSPNDFDAWHLKASILLYFKNDIASAIDAEARALKIRNDYLPAHEGSVNLHLMKGDLAAATTQFEQLHKILPNHPLTNYLSAELAFVKQDFKSAKDSIQQVLKVSPNNFKALQLAGAIETKGGSPLQAETFLRKALQIEDQASTRKLLAEVYLRSGNPGKALETVKPLLEGADADSQVLSQGALAYVQMGEMAKAETYFTKAAQLDPADVKNKAALALAQLAKGNSDSGYSQLERLAAADTGNFADLALISAYVQKGKYDDAAHAIAALEAKQPGKALTADLKGRVQLARKDQVGARQSFETALARDPSYLPAALMLARLDIEGNKPELAKQRFEDLLKKDPNNLQILLALAEVKSRTGGDKEEVAKALRDAIRANPTQAQPRLMLIDQLLRRKEVKQALSAAQEGVAAMPDSPEMLEALGRTQALAGDANQAVTSFSRLAEMLPTSPQPLLGLADAYIAMKNTNAARQSVKRALVISPNLLVAQRSLIQLELMSGHPEDALEIAKSIQVVPGREAIGYLFVGDIEATRKRFGAAAQAYRAGLAKSPSSETAVKLHAVLTADSRAAEADTFAKTWSDKYPRDVAFLQYLGDLALSRLDYPLAESRYRAVIQIRPDNAIAFNNLAYVAAQQKKPEALKYAETANKLAPNQPAFMDTLAVILAREGQVSKALDLEKQVIAQRPQHMPYRLNLARIYIQSGDKASAKVELDQLAKLGASFPGQAEVSKLLKTL
jgi:putative PEP-CTERM system TPR-repeat lipoprotein